MRPMQLPEIPVPYEVRFIPNDDQEYNTPGNYFLENGILIFTISQLPNMLESFAILVHEMTELALLMEKHPEKSLAEINAMIDAFDYEYEDNADRTGGDDSEPGDDPAAPYHREHQAATAVERAFIDALGIDWDAYDARVRKLRETYRQS